MIDRLVLRIAFCIIPDVSLMEFPAFREESPSDIQLRDLGRAIEE